MADENKGLNPKLQAMFEGGTDDYLGVVRTEESDRSRTMKQLMEIESDISSDREEYIHSKDIFDITGKTAEELELDLDNDDEISKDNLKTIYDANTTRINKFQEFLDTEATEQDYIDVVSGKYSDTADWTFGYGYSMRNALTQSKHNSPANNFKAAQELGKLGYEEGSYRESFADKFNLDWKGIEHILSDSGWSDDSGHIMGNDSINDGHVYKMVEMYPEFAAKGLTHDKFNDRAREQFLDKDENWDHIDGRRLEQLMDKNIRGQRVDGHLYGDERDIPTSKFAHQILKNKPGLLREKNLDTVLGGLDDDDRNKWIDETLGITGGEHQHTLPNESEDFSGDNWDNWTEGDGASFDMGLRNAIASSRHLTDDQADHIKRHGDFDSKYSLYHNDKIDTRHGVEMYKKWGENHDEHGYDSEELIEKYKEDKDDKFGFDELPEDVQDELTSSDDFYEHVDEAAESNYTLENYMDDNKASIIEKMKGNSSISEKLTEHVDDAVRENYDDWMGENPNSKQNVGNPQFDALDTMNGENELENSMFTTDELGGEESVKTLLDLGLKPDDEGYFDGDEIIAELDKFGGPSQIDHETTDEGIWEHPEYQDRFSESMDGVYDDAFEGNIENVRPYEISDELYLYEDHRESTGYQEAHGEASDEWKADTDNYREHADELFTNSHTDDRFIPDHVAMQMPEFAEVRKKRSRDARSSDIEDLPNRAFEHAYGEDQHHHELLKDYADANGGSIDVGKMHKKFPNLKETWKKIFGGKGKLTSDDIQQKTDDIPKTNYDVTYGKWGGSQMQNINQRNQVIVRLDHSDESLKAIHDHEDPAVKEMFNKIQNVSKQSGHPTNDRTIAWARVDTSDPEHWMIDEVQSDFGKTAQKYLKDQGHGGKADAIKTINDIHKDWRETITNHVVKTAKTHGAMKISTHSPESKASHTGSSSVHTVYKDSYKKVPKKMGFQEAHHSELPLTDKGAKHFAAADETQKDLPGHTLDLTPENLKKAIEIVIDLIKADMINGKIRKSMFDHAFNLQEPDDLEKGDIGRAAKGLVIAGAMAMGAHEMGQEGKQKAPQAQERSVASVKTEAPSPSFDNLNNKRHTLNSISDVHYQSSRGIERGDHNKERKFGRYGMSPITIKETIKSHPDLSKRYGHLANFKGRMFREGMKAADRDGKLSDEIASRHYDKLAEEYDHHSAKIAHAWDRGIYRTNRTIKYGGNVNNHDYVKKVMKAHKKHSRR